MNMIEVRRTDTFDKWFKALRDDRALARIARRIDRLAEGHAGDVKSVGDGVSEMRIDVGPEYRVYFTRRGEVIFILLCGGDKSSQDRDIRTAKALVGKV